MNGASRKARDRIHRVSGGSYNYLYLREPGRLMDEPGDLERMIDDLAALGYAEDVATISMSLLVEIRIARVRISTLMERLAPAWQAREWWASSDDNEDGFKRTLEDWRRGQSSVSPAAS